MAMDRPPPPEEPEDRDQDRPARPEEPEDRDQDRPQSPDAAAVSPRRFDPDRDEPIGSRAELRIELTRRTADRAGLKDHTEGFEPTTDSSENEPVDRRTAVEPEQPSGSRTELRTELAYGLTDQAGGVPKEPGDRPPGPDATPDAVVDDDQPSDPREHLYAFGNRHRIKETRIERDLKVESPDAVIGPFSPSGPTDDNIVGKSAFVDPERAPLTGHFHVLPVDAKLPHGLAVHADGEDVGGDSHWGHRLIYPTEPMTAARFNELVESLDWRWSGFKKDKKGGKGVDE